ncbi:YopX protein [Enterococcus faecalis]|uniref:YopX family protein n=1 Tax=Enterococcus faecalis TaxID=1351 RepID=UPI000878534A|nr:YopX family protein [Enterococcus faecalis]OFA12365.1 YopX protein [Enterococcus faecalis]
MIPKFRAWDKNTNDMVDVKTIDLEKDGSIGCIVDYNGINLDVSECVLMQSTGLKDKNGVDVYQGDIIRCTRGCPHEVIWLEEYGGTFFGGMPAWYLSGLEKGYAWTGEEVIGNIYENPELLEGTE